MWRPRSVPFRGRGMVERCHRCEDDFALDLKVIPFVPGRRAGRLFRGAQGVVDLFEAPLKGVHLVAATGANTICQIGETKDAAGNCVKLNASITCTGGRIEQGVCGCPTGTTLQGMPAYTYNAAAEQVDATPPFTFTAQ